MENLEQLKLSIAALSKRDMKKFAAWYSELQSDVWDKQIEADAKAGRLDKLADKARADLKAGRVSLL